MVVLITAVIGALAIFLFCSLRISHLNFSDDALRPEKLYAIDNWLDKIYKQGKFNGTILLAKKGEVLFSKAYGFNDGENSSELSEHSSFNLASVSKQFTAMGIVILKSRSLLDYKDKVSRYIPELAFYDEITIQHLLHHTSGIPDYMRMAVMSSNKEELLTVAEMIALYQNNKPKLRFKPGEKFEYSNAGYVLLAEIIARIAKQPFSQFMAESIFIPLNMKNTQVFNLLSEQEPKDRVYGYAYSFLGSRKRIKDLNHFDGVAGDGGIYSSAYDLNIWHEALKVGTLVTNDIYKEAYKPGQLNDGSKTKYGFGWFINDNQSVEHAGGWQGFTSYIYRNLENDELIVILDNSSNALRVNAIGYRFNSIGLNLKNVIESL